MYHYLLSPIIVWLSDIYGTGIPNAEILIHNNDFNYTLTADNTGHFSINTMFEGEPDEVPCRTSGDILLHGTINILIFEQILLVITLTEG